MNELSFGQYLRLIREGNVKEYSLRGAARVIGKSPSWLSRAERDIETPSFETCLELASHFNCDPDELLSRIPKYKRIMDYARGVSK